MTANPQDPGAPEPRTAGPPGREHRPEQPFPSLAESKRGTAKRSTAKRGSAVSRRGRAAAERAAKARTEAAGAVAPEAVPEPAPPEAAASEQAAGPPPLQVRPKRRRARKAEASAAAVPAMPEPAVEIAAVPEAVIGAAVPDPAGHGAPVAEAVPVAEESVAPYGVPRPEALAADSARVPMTEPSPTAIEREADTAGAVAAVPDTPVAPTATTDGADESRPIADAAPEAEATADSETLPPMPFVPDLPPMEPLRVPPMAAAAPDGDAHGWFDIVDTAPAPAESATTAEGGGSASAPADAVPDSLRAAVGPDDEANRPNESEAGEAAPVAAATPPSPVEETGTAAAPSDSTVDAGPVGPTAVGAPPGAAAGEAAIPPVPAATRPSPRPRPAEPPSGRKPPKPPRAPKPPKARKPRNRRGVRNRVAAMNLPTWMRRPNLPSALRLKAIPVRVFATALVVALALFAIGTLRNAATDADSGPQQPEMAGPVLNPLPPRGSASPTATPTPTPTGSPSPSGSAGGDSQTPGGGDTTDPGGGGTTPPKKTDEPEKTTPPKDQPLPGSGSYRIQASSGGCLDQASRSNDDIVTGSCSSSIAADGLSAQGGGNYLLTMYHPDNGPGCITAGEPNTGAGFYAKGCGDDGQLMHLDKVSNGVYRIRVVDSGVCLSVSGGSAVTASCGGATTFKFIS